MRNYKDQQFLEGIMQEHAVGEELDFEIATKIMKERTEELNAMDKWLNRESEYSEGLSERWSALKKTRKTVRDRIQIALEAAIHECRQLLEKRSVWKVKPDTCTPWPPWRVIKVKDWPPKWNAVKFKGPPPRRRYDNLGEKYRIRYGMDAGLIKYGDKPGYSTWHSWYSVAYWLRKEAWKKYKEKVNRKKPQPRQRGWLKVGRCCLTCKWRAEGPSGKFIKCLIRERDGKPSFDTLKLTH